MGFLILWDGICNGGATLVVTVPKQSWHYRSLTGLFVIFLKDFLSFFYFPYATSYILSYIPWFPLILLVPSLCSGNSSTLLSRLSPGYCPSPNLPALHVMYLEPSFDYTLNSASNTIDTTSIKQIHSIIKYSIHFALSLLANLCVSSTANVSIATALSNHMIRRELFYKLPKSLPIYAKPRTNNYKPET
jgi:hypothetical protein